MKRKPVGLRRNLRPILGLAIFVLGCMTGCANNPNWIPQGYSAMIDKLDVRHPVKKIVRQEAARLDYPVPTAVNAGDQAVELYWTTDGTLDWGRPFWKKVRWWRYALVAQDAPVDTPAICYNNWTEVGSDDPTKVDNCKISVNDYIGKPFVAMLSYSFEEAKPKDDDYDYPEVTRMYYLVLK